MKKIHWLMSLMLLAIAPAFAQKISVSESSEMIEKISRSGMHTIIELDEKKVSKAWEKFLKNYGKIESSKGILTIPVANIGAISGSPCKVISKVQSSNKGTKVWWAIDMGSSLVTSSSNNSAYKSAEKLLRDFAAQCYRDDINDQIADAEKALEASTKKQERTIKDGENLKGDLEKNAKDKIDLENRLKQNAQDKVTLEKNIEQNKTDQSAAAQDVEKMKKALEAVKLKLNGIE